MDETWKKLTAKITYLYAATTPAQAAVEDLFEGIEVKFGVNYLGTRTTAHHMFPDPDAVVPTGTIDGATAVTTMGSVLAAVSLFALAAW